MYNQINGEYVLPAPEDVLLCTVHGIYDLISHQTTF